MYDKGTEDETTNLPIFNEFINSRSCGQYTLHCLFRHSYLLKKNFLLWAEDTNQCKLLSFLSNCSVATRLLLRALINFSVCEILVSNKNKKWQRH